MWIYHLKGSCLQKYRLGNVRGTVKIFSGLKSEGLLLWYDQLISLRFLDVYLVVLVTFKYFICLGTKGYNFSILLKCFLWGESHRRQIGRSDSRSFLELKPQILDKLWYVVCTLLGSFVIVYTYNSSVNTSYTLLIFSELVRVRV